MLALDRLTVGYSGTRGAVLGNVDVTVPPGSFICVLGRNGAGKSTLMRTISGLQPALTGRACLDQQDIASLRSQERAQSIAVVLTERFASPGLTVNDVVAMGRSPFTDWRGRLSAADHQLVADALEMAGTAPFTGRWFDDLSDGERQRVMIARAIAQTPRLMVLDEITAFLDLPGRVETMALLREHARKIDSIVLLSSQDLDLSLQLADSVWLLGGAGKMIIGTADDLIDAGEIGRASTRAKCVSRPHSGVSSSLVEALTKKVDAARGRDRAA